MNVVFQFLFLMLIDIALKVCNEHSHLAGSIIIYSEEMEN